MIYSNCITRDYERKLGGNEKQMNITYNFQNVAIFKQGWEITWISLSAVIVALHGGKNKIIKDKQILGYMLWLAHGKRAYITNTNAFVYSIYYTNVCALCSCCTASLALCIVCRPSSPMRCASRGAAQLEPWGPAVFFFTSISIWCTSLHKHGISLLN